MAQTRIMWPWYRFRWQSDLAGVSRSREPDQSVGWFVAPSIPLPDGFSAELTTVIRPDAIGTAARHYRFGQNDDGVHAQPFFIMGSSWVQSWTK